MSRARASLPECFARSVAFRVAHHDARLRPREGVTAGALIRDTRIGISFSQCGLHCRLSYEPVTGCSTASAWHFLFLTVAPSVYSFSEAVSTSQRYLHLPCCA